MGMFRNRVRSILAVASIIKILIGVLLITHGQKFGFYFEIRDTPIGEFCLSFGIVGLVTVF